MSFNKTKTDYVGKLFINEFQKDNKISKKGDKYLRGTVNGVEVVGFLAKDGNSFNLKLDTNKKEEVKDKPKSDAPF